MMKSRPLGRNAELIQIIEFHAPTHDAQWMLPDAEPHIFKQHSSLLAGRFWMPETNRLVFTNQLWLLKMNDAIVLIDTGCGNHKPRVSEYQNMINTPVLEWLRAVGAPPEAVTHVLHTHLHMDHVGWNTRLIDGRWVPTFPNATYYMPKLDYEMFKQRQAVRMGPEVYEGMLHDSLVPVFDAGLTRFVEDGDEIAGLVASPAPGHTPGSVVYTLRHNGDEIIFVGDVLHSPVQVILPHVNSRWCENQTAARETRHALLQRAAASKATVIPAHANDIEGWHIGRCKDGFSIGFETSAVRTLKPEPAA
jgi:glyoxylase-like metal-dependent hydrolase (beta-lactamase superfamily II)